VISAFVKTRMFRLTNRSFWYLSVVPPSVAVPCWACVGLVVVPVEKGRYATLGHGEVAVLATSL